MKTGEMYLPQSIIDVCKVWQKLGNCVLFPRNAITFMLCGSPNSTWVHSVAAALPAGLIARLRYEQGRLNEAESLLIDQMPLINAGNVLDCALSAYFVMAKIAVHRMNFELAHTLSRKQKLGQLPRMGTPERRCSLGADASMS